MNIPKATVLFFPADETHQVATAVESFHFSFSVFSTRFHLYVSALPTDLYFRYYKDAVHKGLLCIIRCFPAPRAVLQFRLLKAI